MVLHEALSFSRKLTQIDMRGDVGSSNYLHLVGVEHEELVSLRHEWEFVVLRPSLLVNDWHEVHIVSVINDFFEDEPHILVCFGDAFHIQFSQLLVT